jgi:hypothetical protein
MMNNEHVGKEPDNVIRLPATFFKQQAIKDPPKKKSTGSSKHMSPQDVKSLLLAQQILGDMGL